ncbi:MAG TPA: hypothetical protein PLH75_03850 [Amaricoccus sp.]|uniref:hypothetical protein n=1 Tax=Amaricoccus sp. TaxID=1872485 RepID=UPI002CABD611|nr:hypothetical protein [Amaricoccus sp.]HPG21907.1 hypothetical protein [Amaricoccus sp.]HRW15673.1 hypothetical protein [Amaricoccus sp.]
MTMIASIPHRRPTAGLRGVLSEYLADFRSRREWRRRQRELEMLLDAPDYLLADIGVTRLDIRQRCRSDHSQAL